MYQTFYYARQEAVVASCAASISGILIIFETSCLPCKVSSWVDCDHCAASNIEIKIFSAIWFLFTIHNYRLYWSFVDWSYSWFNLFNFSKKIDIFSMNLGHCSNLISTIYHGKDISYQSLSLYSFQLYLNNLGHYWNSLKISKI